MRARTITEVTSETVLIDRKTAGILYSLGWQTLDKVATECGAKCYIGKRVLYHRRKLEEHFNTLVN